MKSSLLKSPITRRHFISTSALAAVSLTLRAQKPAHTEAEAKSPIRAPILDPSTLAPFVDPLPIPAIAKSAGTRPDPDDPKQQIPFYRLPIAETPVKLHRDLPPTRMWTIGGSFPGPTLESPIAQGMIVEWQNQLPQRHLFAIDHVLHGAEITTPDVRAVIHLHGGRTPAASDGYPEEWTLPGQSQTCHYPSLQHAATLFYHDHTMGINRLNTWAGMMGFCILRDAREDPLNLPTGPRDIPILICDRTLRADGQLDYPVSEKPGEVWVPEAFGDAILANGKLLPYLDVEPTLYRFRLLNASNGRFFRPSLTNPALPQAPAAHSQSPAAQFFAISSDQGLLAAPVPLRRITLAPAERADILIDFASLAGQHLELISDSFSILQFRVAGNTKPVIPTGARTTNEIVIPSKAPAETRDLLLNTPVILSGAPAQSKNLLFTSPAGTKQSVARHGSGGDWTTEQAESRQGRHCNLAAGPTYEPVILSEARSAASKDLLFTSPEGTEQSVARHGSAGNWTTEHAESRQGRHSNLAAGPTYEPVILSEAPAQSKNLLLTSQTAPSIPATLHETPRLAESAAVRTRRLTLDENMDMVKRSMGMLLNNTPWHAPITEKPVLHSVEIWELVNLTDDSHPIHLHLVRFQILDRRPFDQFAYQSKSTLHYFGPAQPPAPEEMGWKDTVRADPAMVTRIIIPFDGYAGRYIWHCHILEHEDNEMMRPYEVLSEGSPS